MDLGSRADCAPMRVGLLEVVTEDLGELWRPIGRLALEPFGVPFVQTSTIFAGHALIRSEPDQRVTEPESVRVSAVDQALALQGIEMALDERTRVVGKKRTHRVLLYVQSGDRCTAQHVALAGSETVEPHRQQSTEGARHGVGEVVVEGGKQLLREQRVSLRDLDDSA